MAKELSQKQQLAVEMFSKGFRASTVADGCEVTMATLRNWKKIPSFREALAESIQLKTETSNYKLHTLFRKSLETCDQLMDSKNEHIRLGAARLAAESYSAIVRAAEDKQMLVEMESRMEALQSNMQQAQPILEAAQDADFQDVDDDFAPTDGDED